MILRLGKTFMVLVIVGLAGLSHAIDNPSMPLASQQAVKIPSLTVKKRLEAIEQINVTAQKVPEPVNDAQLQAILDEAAALEAQVKIGVDAN